LRAAGTAGDNWTQPGKLVSARAAHCAMKTLRLLAALATLAAAAYWFAGCASTAPSAPMPEVRPVNVSAAPAAHAQSSQADNGWNIFPDPTTGEIAVYHNGKYEGVITGNEPGDPPMPHKAGANSPEPPAVSP
jgi:hypothetical protein